MREPAAPRFLYVFSVWPDETWTFDRAVIELFEVLGGRIEVSFTEAGFQRFRSGLSHHGLTLREISRVPEVEPEVIL